MLLAALTSWYHMDARVKALEDWQGQANKERSEMSLQIRKLDEHLSRVEGYLHLYNDMKGSDPKPKRTKSAHSCGR